MLAKYSKTIFEKDNFSICTFVPDNKNDVPASAISPYGTFTGCGTNIPHTDNIYLNLDGEWEQSKYGLQLKIGSCISILPETEEGIIAFLSSGVLPYIRNKMAVRLYSRFGKNIFSVLENNPKEFLKVKGINENKLKAIRDAYTVNYGYQDLVMLLAPSGISLNKIKKIVDKFGAASTEKVKNNPYVLFTINGFGFKTVDEIARKCNTPTNDPLRIQGALKFVLEEAQLNGNLCIKQEILRQKAYEILNEGFEVQAVSFNEVTDGIIDMAKSGLLKGDGGFVYLSFNYDNEVLSAKKVSEFIHFSEKPLNVDDKITSFESHNFTLALNQKEAVKKFFANRLSIITGGPGTGKSTVLKAILDIQIQINPKSEILLLAPTGKASRRIAQATGKQAFTIHSGLNIKEDTKINDIEAVKADVVIVDEVSMCDQKLFTMLISSVNPRTTKLLLVGDADQLPSVGAGNVLNELINCRKVPVTRLNLVYRQGKDSTIPKNAEKINNGISSLIYDSEFQFIKADEQDDCFNAVINAYLAEIKRVGIENTCILCPMKSRGKNCVNEYNKIIQDIVNPIDKKKPEIHLKNRIFRLGDRIMQTKNADGVSNGETGFIVQIKKDEDDNEIVGIKFDGKNHIFWYMADDLNDITLAYSITIHKSQGSEYKTVIIPMMKSYYVMLKRNLLYTAVTRAKERVILAGQKQAVFMAVNKTETDKRQTQLAKRIS